MCKKSLVAFLSLLFISTFAFSLETYSHKQTIVFDYSGYGIQIYKDICGISEKGERIGELEKGDTVEITEAAFEPKNSDSKYGNLWLKVTVISDDADHTVKNGYLLINTKNPFENWKLIETIDGKEIMSFSDKCEISYGYNLKEKPDHNSKTVKEIQKKVDDTKMYDVLAVSREKYPDEEGKNPSYWVLIDFNGQKVWIHGSHCYKDIGGPTFKTPESEIYYELVYANEI